MKEKKKRVLFIILSLKKDFNLISKLSVEKVHYHTVPNILKENLKYEKQYTLIFPLNSSKALGPNLT